VKASKDLSLYPAEPLRKNEVLFNDALEIKDAGIQYHRSGIGLKNKGGNDLYERLFSDDKNTFKSVMPVWYGKLIDRWVIQADTDEFFNMNYRRVLKESESASFTESAFDETPKILWRQTASCLRATLDTQGRWFRNTIQCAYIRKDFKARLDIYYVLAIANSQYIERAYNELVKEAGRVFPQVKLTHVKKLPLVMAENDEQTKIADLVKRILSAKRRDPKADVSDLESEINRRVDSLYGAKDAASDTVSAVAP
jgi:restriction endonuclease TaqI-like protein